MDLQEFIKNSLLSIKQGIDDANNEISNKNNKTTPETFAVESYQQGRKAVYIMFDIAVTVSKEKKTSGKGSLSGGGKIQVIGNGVNTEASLEGETGNTTKQEHVSRIQVPVAVKIF